MWLLTSTVLDKDLYYAVSHTFRSAPLFAVCKSVSHTRTELIKVAWVLSVCLFVLSDRAKAELSAASTHVNLRCVTRQNKQPELHWVVRIWTDWRTPRTLSARWPSSCFSQFALLLLRILLSLWGNFWQQRVVQWVRSFVLGNIWWDMFEFVLRCLTFDCRQIWAVLNL